jgi:ubiquinone/menaquinone biosynthesis C-methylase UbiE
MKGKINHKHMMLVAGILTHAGWLIYSRRPLERLPGTEELEDPEVSRAFNQIARTPQMRLLRWYAINRALSLLNTGRAVDLGCGPGYLVLELAERAPALQVTGIDLSGEMLVQARSSAQGSAVSSRVDYKTGDAANIPFPDGSLDLVLSTLSLHHWSDPVCVLDEIARVLRPGGAYMIFDLRRDMSPPGYLLLWFATNFIVPAALYRINEPLNSRNAAYTPDEAAQLAEQSNLKCWRIVRGPLWLTIEGKI